MVLKDAFKLILLKCIFEFMINTALPDSNSVQGREKCFKYNTFTCQISQCQRGAVVWELTSHAGGSYCVGSNPGEAIFFFLIFFFPFSFLFLFVLCVCVLFCFLIICVLYIFLDYEQSPIRPQGQQSERNACARENHPTREKATRGGVRENFFFLSPRRLGFLAWGDFHAGSRFACSTIPEEKWVTTRSLRFSSEPAKYRHYGIPLGVSIIRVLLCIGTSLKRQALGYEKSVRILQSLSKMWRASILTTNLLKTIRFDRSITHLLVTTAFTKKKINELKL